MTGAGGVGPTCHDRGCSTGGQLQPPTHPRGTSRSCSLTPARYPCPLYLSDLSRLTFAQKAVNITLDRGKQGRRASSSSQKGPACAWALIFYLSPPLLSLSPTNSSSNPIPSHSPSFKSKCRAPGKRVAIDHNPTSETSWVAALKSESASQLHRQGHRKTCIDVRYHLLPVSTPRSLNIWVFFFLGGQECKPKQSSFRTSHLVDEALESIYPAANRSPLGLLPRRRTLPDIPGPPLVLAGQLRNYWVSGEIGTEKSYSRHKFHAVSFWANCTSKSTIEVALTQATSRNLMPGPPLACNYPLSLPIAPPSVTFLQRPSLCIPSLPTFLTYTHSLLSTSAKTSPDINNNSTGQTSPDFALTISSS